MTTIKELENKVDDLISNNKIQQIVNAANQLKQQVQTTVTQINGSNTNITNITNSVTQIKTKADTILTQIKQTQTTANATSSEITGKKTEVDDLISSIKTKANDSLQKISADSNNLISEINKSQEALDLIHLQSEEARIKINSQYSSIEKNAEKVNDLLEGATTFALANSFGERKKEVVKNQFWIYVGFIVLLATIPIIVSLLYNFEIITIQLGWSSFLLVLPWIFPSIWAAKTFSTKAHDNVKLEEFYAQKETLAKAYMGYKGEIEDLSRKDDRFEELLILMKTNLITISQNSMPLISKEAPDSLMSEALKKVNNTLNLKNINSKAESATKALTENASKQ